MAGLSADAVKVGLTDPDAWHLHVFDEVPSTNTLALDLAGGGAPERTALLADSQTAGRGRGGREWRTPPGVALALSVIIRPRFTSELWPWIGLAAAFAVRDGIERVAGLRGTLKWPNDVLISGRKVAGVLMESRFHQSDPSGGAVVVGIGVNVNNRAAAFPESFRDTAASVLDLSGVVTDRNELAAAILNGLDHEMRSLPGAIGTYQDRWRTVSATFGTMVTISTPTGVVEGIDRGLDAQGRLILDTREGERAIHTGDVLQCRTVAPLLG
jgi:BirA family biotin operon repressor/biotin-[acetyl-CoA-carboxylase] ligase